MIVLPIVERELRVAARRRGTYWMRVTAALVAIVVFGWMLLTLFRDSVPSASHGRYLFRTLFTFAFIYCLFVGARLTADCLSEEKREGTLGLLFLTDLKGYDVIFGKLAATSLKSVYGLLAILPVMSLPVQLGGVTANELWRSALVLLDTLFFSLVAGLFVSALSRHERKGMFAAVFVLLFATFGPPLLAFLLSMSFGAPFDRPEAIWPILIFSPGYSFGLVMTGTLPFSPFPKSSFWWSLAVTHLITWGLLMVASLVLPRIWQAHATNSKLDRHRERVEQWAYGRADVRSSHRSRLLDINPFLWLVSRERWKPGYVWLYLGAVAATWLWGWWKYSDVMFDKKTLVPTVLLFQVFLKIWIVSEACNRLAEDRRIGALELLLSTPLTTREILRGQWLALQRQFAKPVLVILLLEFLLLRQQFSTSMVLTNLVMLVADTAALGWVGMWLGLTARNLNRAILGTIARVLVLPWVFFYAIGFGLEILSRLSGRGPFEPGPNTVLYSWFVIGLLNNFVFGFCWARRNLLREFRAVATQRYQTENAGWIKRLLGRQRAEALPSAAVAGVMRET